MTTACSSSLSKGVFLLKGKKSVANAQDYLRALDHRRPCAEERMKLYSESWSIVNSILQEIELASNCSVFNELVAFAQTAHTPCSNSSIQSKGETVARFIVPLHADIPTAAFVTGGNVTDHATMFSNLVFLLEARVSKHVVLLKSVHCSNLKSMFSSTISQLINRAVPDDMEDDTDISEPMKNIRRQSCTMSTISAWYSNLKMEAAGHQLDNEPISDSHIARAESEQHATSTYNKSIIIVIEDFEAFLPNILQDFISICSHYARELPLVMVFGIATSLASLHQTLPYQVSSLLALHTFNAPVSSDYLSLVLERILMNVQCPFKLGGHAFDFLLDTFLFHDFSVANFISAFKFCMLEHYVSKESSVVCVPSSDLDNRVATLTNMQLDYLRSITSFRNYVEHRPAREQILLLEDETYTKQVITTILHELNDYHSTFYPVLHALHGITAKLPHYPLGKQIRELYATGLSLNVCDTTEYQKAVVLLRSLSHDELLKYLNIVIDQLSLGHRGFLNNYSEGQAILTKIHNFVHLLSFPCDVTMVDSTSSQDNQDCATLSVILPKKVDMFTLKQTLQGLDNKKRKIGIFEQLRIEAIDYLDTQLFRKYLSSPSCMVLYETVYYNDVNQLKQHISAAPRSTIQRALTNPYLYLQNDSLQLTNEESVGHISSNLPDLCIVFNLHLECGRLINLYDWLQAFVMIVESRGDDLLLEERSSSDRQVDREIHARFIRAVSELHVLGFVKSTRRKTDHVARLTWGC